MRDEEDRAWKDRLAKKNRGVADDAQSVTEMVAQKTKELKDQTLGK